MKWKSATQIAILKTKPSTTMQSEDTLMWFTRRNDGGKYSPCFVIKPSRFRNGSAMTSPQQKGHLLRNITHCGDNLPSHGARGSPWKTLRKRLTHLVHEHSVERCRICSHKDQAWGPGPGTVLLLSTVPLKRSPAPGSSHVPALGVTLYLWSPWAALPWTWPPEPPRPMGSLCPQQRWRCRRGCPAGCSGGHPSAHQTPPSSGAFAGALAPGVSAGCVTGKGDDVITGHDTVVEPHKNPENYQECGDPQGGIRLGF